MKMYVINVTKKTATILLHDAKIIDHWKVYTKKQKKLSRVSKFSTN